VGDAFTALGGDLDPAGVVTADRRVELGRASRSWMPAVYTRRW
jgi:hypothetical protein